MRCVGYLLEALVDGLRELDGYDLIRHCFVLHYSTSSASLSALHYIIASAIQEDHLAGRSVHYCLWHCIVLACDPGMQPPRGNVGGGRQELARVQRRGAAETQCRSHDSRRVARI